MHAPQFAFNAGVVALLALSLGLKYLTTNRVDVLPIDPLHNIATELRTAGFVVHEVQSDPAMPALAAYRSDCRLKAVRISPMGWHNPLLTGMVWTGATITFAYDGLLYAEFPLWKARFEYAQKRLAKHAGISSGTLETFAIVADDGCPRPDRLLARFTASGVPARDDHRFE